MHLEANQPSHAGMGSTCRVKWLAVCSVGIPPAGEVDRMPGDGAMGEITSTVLDCGLVAKDSQQESQLGQGSESARKSRLETGERVEGCGIADKGGFS